MVKSPAALQESRQSVSQASGRKGKISLRVSWQDQEKNHTDTDIWELIQHKLLWDKTETVYIQKTDWNKYLHNQHPVGNRYMPLICYVRHHDMGHP